MSGQTVGKEINTVQWQWISHLGMKDKNARDKSGPALSLQNKFFFWVGVKDSVRTYSKLARNNHGENYNLCSTVKQL